MLSKILTAKISKKILYKTLEGIFTAKIANIKILCFLSFLYIKGVNIKMAAITKETYENNGIEVITDEFDQWWLNERHVQKQLELKNLPALTNKYDKEYKKADLN